MWSHVPALLGAAMLCVAAYRAVTGNHGGGHGSRYPAAGFVQVCGSREPRTLRSLVGTRIVYRGRRFTVLDDSDPAMDPARRFGGRAAAVTLDQDGAVGKLLLGFDHRGRLFEAAAGAEPWSAARLGV